MNLQVVSKVSAVASDITCAVQGETNVIDQMSVSGEDIDEGMYIVISILRVEFGNHL